MFGLLGLLATKVYLIFEIFFGPGTIGFHIIGAYTGSGPNNLFDQNIVDAIC